MKKKTILIVEDDPSIHRLLVNALQMHGYETLSAEDGEEALQVLKAQTPDVVLTDIRMPVMDGLELLARIRAIHADMPVIMISVWKEREQLEQVAKHKVTAYLQKPFNMNQLLEKLQEATGSEAQPRAQKPGSIAAPKVPIRLPALKASWIAAIAFVTAGAALSFFWLGRNGESGSAVSYRLPYSNPTGLAWDGKNLWVSDWSTQMIYRHRMDARLTMEKFYMQNEVNPLSIAWGERALWSVSPDGAIRKHDPQTLAVENTYRVPDLQPSALAWDGKNLWSCDEKNREIHKHAADGTLAVEVSYQYPGARPVGMLWEGSDLWIADEESNSIYRLFFDGKLFTIVGNYTLDAHRNGANKLSGLTFDSDSVWTVSEGKGLAFRHPRSKLK